MKKLLLLSFLLVSCGAETITVYCRDEVKKVEFVDRDTIQGGWIETTKWYIDTLEICE